MQKVTERINNFTWPPSYKIKKSDFEIKAIDDIGKILSKKNNEDYIKSSIVGEAVECLSKNIIWDKDVYRINDLDGKVEFFLSLFNLDSVKNKSESQWTKKTFEENYQNIKNDLSDESIKSAFILSLMKLHGYTVNNKTNQNINLFKKFQKKVEAIQKYDGVEIHNTRVMVKRVQKYFADINSDDVINDCCVYGGKTQGIIDLVSGNTLWEFKTEITGYCQKDNITDKIKIKFCNTKLWRNTKQLIAYFLLLRRDPRYKENSIQFLGIINPRIGFVYLLDIEKIDVSLLDYLDKKLIGFDTSFF